MERRRPNWGSAALLLKAICGRQTVPRRVKEPRTKYLFARISPAEQEILQRAADAEFLSLAAWARQTLLRRAAELLEVRPEE